MKHIYKEIRLGERIMLRIGKSYIVRKNEVSRLCADIIINGYSETLWFSVNSLQEEYLSLGRADPFLMLVLPLAMRGGHEIICEDYLSERLYYQLSNYLIPTLSATGNFYFPVKITAHLVAEKYVNQGAVGIGFSNYQHFSNLINKQDEEGIYPLTHLVVFNCGSFSEKQNEESFQERCQQAEKIAKDRNLKTVYVDTNIQNIIQEEYLTVSSFRNISCVLALQGLFSVYLFSSDYSISNYKLDFKDSARYDLLTMPFSSTESLSVYLIDGEMKNRRKGFNNHKKEYIKIGFPYIEKKENGIYLCAKVSWKNQEHIMYFSVKGKYGSYLTIDRADAFVIGLLTKAMREDMNIICDAPLTRRLLYQLNNYLIPIMSSNMDEYHSIRVQAEPTDVILESVGAVGTGWTAGVDSMFTYMDNYKNAKGRYKLTHLLIANNGAIEGDRAKDTLKKMVEKTETGFAAETGMEVIGVDTNLQELCHEDFIAVVSFRHTAVILALQKLFRAFLISSSYSFSNFSFVADNIGFYELAILNCFETDNTVIYSSGGVFSRLQKIEKLADFSLAQKYLHPCIYALRDNCGQCGKCIRTETALYGLGSLKYFSKVFDVKEFEQNKDWYFMQLLLHQENADVRDVLALLHQKGIKLTGAKRKVKGILLKRYFQKIREKCRI